MATTVNSFRNYIFVEADDNNRLILQHEILKPNFEHILAKVLDEYGLAEKLHKAKTTGEKVRILDFGCAEGLYLHDVAAVLEERGLLEAADLNGIDINPGAIATADEFSKISKPARPGLNFYVHDGKQPLESCLGLQKNGAAQFDFIYAMVVMEHFSEARQHVERLYGSLKPGGVIYLRDYVLDEGPEGWLVPHPALIPFSKVFTGHLRSINPGVNVTIDQAGWLREIGAELIHTELDIIPIGGETKRGMDMLRNSIMITRNAGPMLIAKGVMTQAAFDALMATLFKEINRDSIGQASHIDTLARKPLGS